MSVLRSFSRIADSLTSFVAGLGTSRDKAATVAYTFAPMTRDQLLAMYRGAWLPRKIVEIPADDACRKWRDWQAKAGQIEKIEAEEIRLNVRLKVHTALVFARLYGGCGILIGDGTSNPEQPLDPNSIKLGGIKHLTVIPRLYLSAGDIVSDPYDPMYNQPGYYTLGSGKALRIHPSRLVIFKGPPTGEEITTDGWGDSVLQSVYTAVRNADSTAENVASLVFEAKVDVFKIPGFMGSLGDAEYRDTLMKRFQLAAAAKGINGAILLDSEEDYQQKSASFSALDAIMDRFMQIVSGAADVPMTRLFGQAPAGMSSTGEGDLRNYYDKTASHQSLHITPAMSILDECIIRSALGSRDPSIHYRWASLWQSTEKENAEIGERSANTIKTLVDTGLFAPEALADSGATMLVERGILPGLEQAIADAPVFDPREPPPDPNNDPGNTPPPTGQ